MTRKLIYILPLLFFILLTSSVIAGELQGTVYGIDADGKKEPLPGANVQWLGTNTGTVADKTGKFSIQSASRTRMLTATYVGYESDTIEVKDLSMKVEFELKSNLTSGEVVVTASQPARMISTSTPVKSESITLRGLQKAACCNLSESFQTNPSVDVSFTNAVTGAKQIQMLGLQGVYIQMLNEQAPAMRGLTSNLGLDYIPGPWMESIQISKGLASVATGYESISGQINVEYKKPDNSKPLFLNVYSNQLGRFEANATSAIKLGENLSTMFFGHTSFNQAKLDMNGDSFLDKPLSKQFNFMNRWSYHGQSWESKTILKALYDEKDGGQTGYWPACDKTYYGMQIKSRKLELLTKNGFIFPGNTYKSLGTVLSVSHYFVESFFDKSLYNGEQNSVYAKVMYQSEFIDSTHKYITGLSYSWDNFVENIQSAGKTSPRYDPKMESIPGAFIEYTFTGIKDLTFMGGFRADFPNHYKAFLTPRFHLQYKIDENNSIRASAGKGYRIANVHAEEIGMFASSRKMFMDEKQMPEEAWNYGVNGTSLFNVLGLDFTLNAEYYRTDFINQIIVDMEQSTTEMHIYNLKGESYSNSVQVDLMFEPYLGITLTTAYRFNDVMMTHAGTLTEKPMQSRQKGFVNIGYTTDDDSWNIDFTTEYNGSGRLANTSANPVEYRMGSTFPSYILLHSQVTKRFTDFEIYAGGENLTDFRQKYAIISSNDPRGKYFEGSFIWGPVVGRVIYLGARYNLN